jgi:hypothetical protein
MSRNIKASKACAKLIKEISSLVDRYPNDSHTFLARMLSNAGSKTMTGKAWTSQNLRLFMTNRGIHHKSNDFSIANIVAECRPESMRLI